MTMTMIIHKKDISKAIDSAEDYLEFSNGTIKTIDKSITIESKIEVKGGSFDFIVDARILKKAIQYSPEIVMIDDGNDSININESFKIRKIGQIENDFDPDFENEIDVKNLAEMIRKTVVFIEDDNRAHFTSNRMVCDGGQFRLESNSTGCGIICFEKNEGEFEPSLVLRKDLKKLSFIEKDSCVKRSNSIVSIKSGADLIQLQQAQGEYPDFQKVIEQKENFRIKLTVSELQQAIKENILFYDKHVFMSEMIIDNDMLYLKTNNGMIGDVHKKVKIEDCENEKSVWFNFNFINSFLSVIDSEEIEIAFIGKSHSMKIDISENGIQTYFFQAPLKT